MAHFSFVGGGIRWGNTIFKFFIIFEFEILFTFNIKKRIKLQENYRDNYRISPPNSPSHERKIDQKRGGGITYSEVHFAIIKKNDGGELSILKFVHILYKFS